MTARVPMVVLGGFLGAGKTTLLNRILSGDHGVRYAVLVNDFGALDVDGGLVAAHGGDTVTFANGCVCCSMGDDLMGAIDRLLDGNRPPERILVEASGVADPAPIADVATLHPGLVRDLVVVLADAGTLRSRHEDRRLRDTVARQLDAADLLVLNKCDRVSEGECGATESWVRDRARVPIVRTVGADVPLALLSAVQAEAPAPEPAVDAPGYATDADVAPVPSPTMPAEIHAREPVAYSPESAEIHAREPAAYSPESAEIHAREPAAYSPEHAVDTNAGAALSCASEPEIPAPALPADPSGRLNDADTRGAPAHIAKTHLPAPVAGSPRHDHRFVSRTVPCPDPIDPERLRAALVALMPRVLRAKGFVITTTGGPEEDWMVVQACGRTVELERRRPAPDSATASFPGLVFIGLDDLPDEDELSRAVRRASIRDSSRSGSCGR